MIYLLLFIVGLIVVCKVVKKLIIKEAEASKEAAKELIFMCCGNCDEFTRHEHRPTHGHCCIMPFILTFFPNNKMNAKWFCERFSIKREWRDSRRVDKNSRPANKGIIAQVIASGIKYDL